MAGKSLIDEADGSSLVDQKPARKVDGSIYIMRHGDTVMDMGDNRSDGWLDMPLTDEGRLELISAQQLLKVIPLATIYTSDLLRTQETAQIMKSGVMSNPGVVIEPKMRTWNLGVLAGVRKEEGRPKVKKLRESPDTASLGGESFNEFKGRFLPWFNKTAQKAVKGKAPVLMVLSGSSLRLLGTDVLGGDESTVDLDEAGLACLHCVGDQWHAEMLLGHEDASPYES